MVSTSSSSDYLASDFYLSTMVRNEEYKEDEKIITKKFFEVFICRIIDDLQPSSEFYAALFLDLITTNSPYVGMCDINVSLEICNPYSRKFFIDLGSIENINLEFLKGYKGRLSDIKVCC